MCVRVCVRMVFAKHKTRVLDHLLYSSDLAPRDLFLFPKVKAVVKDTRLETVQAVI